MPTVATLQTRPRIRRSTFDIILREFFNPALQFQAFCEGIEFHPASVPVARPIKLPDGIELGLIPAEHGVENTFVVCHNEPS